MGTLQLLSLICGILGTVLSVYGNYIIYKYAKEPLEEIDFKSITDAVLIDVQATFDHPSEEQIEKNINKAREDAIKDAFSKQKDKNKVLQVGAKSGMTITAIGGSFLVFSIVFSHIQNCP